MALGDSKEGEFPIQPPEQLAEDYNMLALPGTGSSGKDHLSQLRLAAHTSLKHSAAAAPEVHEGLLMLLTWTRCWLQWTRHRFHSCHITARLATRRHTTPPSQDSPNKDEEVLGIVRIVSHFYPTWLWLQQEWVAHASWSPSGTWSSGEWAHLAVVTTRVGEGSTGWILKSSWWHHRNACVLV